MDTFTKSAPSGSFAQATNNQIVYTGDHGMAWTGYPDGAPSTYSGGAEGYQPSTVLSVHDGVLDFDLHSDSHGNPVGADPSPVPGGNRYQTYGAWSFCEQVAPSDAYDLADFKQAPMLWPQNDSDQPRAESDYPEVTSLNKLDFYGFAHYGGSGAQDYFDVRSLEPNYDPHQWHVYTQTWGPGFRSYYIDGQLVGTSTNQVWSGPERWQLQVEPTGTNDGDSGHVYVKWVWIGTQS
jgi:Glycosyl hydrolases family 16